MEGHRGAMTVGAAEPQPTPTSGALLGKSIRMASCPEGEGVPKSSIQYPESSKLVQSHPSYRWPNPASGKHPAR
jgi:hypothetical protein